MVFVVAVPHWHQRLWRPREGPRRAAWAMVGSPALAAYLSNHPEDLLRNITAELKLGAMGRRFDPLIHGALNVLLKK